MLSDAIKEPHDSMVRPVRVSFFDPRTGEPCDSRPEPLRREKQRATVDELNAAIAKRERDEKKAREISEAMRRRAGLKPDKPRKPRKRPLASPRLLTCPVCGKRFETSETRRVTCSDECAKKRRAEKAKARYAAKVVRTVRECAVCGRSFEVSGKTRKLTCSEACAKVRKRERELAWKAATRGAADAHAQMDSPRTATHEQVSVVK
nr:MAG TPA: zinc-ribbon domain protein [Caudoviricetes sp.]